MLAGLYDARDAALGHEAVIVSHQPLIWITRLHVEGRSFLHDPRRGSTHAASRRSPSTTSGSPPCGTPSRPPT